MCCETIKVLKENIGSKIADVSQSNIFADIPLRPMEIKEKIDGTASNLKASAQQNKSSTK